jgi:hypothetical protein
VTKTKFTLGSGYAQLYPNVFGRNAWSMKKLIMEEKLSNGMWMNIVELQRRYI